MENGNSPRRREIPRYPSEFLESSRNISAMDVPEKLFSHKDPASFIFSGESIPEDDAAKKLELDESFLVATANCYSYSQLVLGRIMELPAVHQEASPMTSGRPSQSSDTFTGSHSGVSLTDGASVFPSLPDDFAKLTLAALGTIKPPSCRGAKLASRWVKDRREKKKEETRAHNAQLHAAISIAALSAAVSAAATKSLVSKMEEEKEEEEAKMDAAIASAATLVAAHCLEAAEAVGAERELLASVVGSAVSARTPGDLVALTAAAATALRGNAALKARALKEVWSVAALLPLDKGTTTHLGHQEQQSLRQVMTKDSVNQHPFTSELLPEDFLAICSQELLAQGAHLLKRTRKGALHWKNVSVYINSSNKVLVKMKSSCAAGTITKKKKYLVVELCKNVVAWPGRHLLEGGDQRYYFGLKTVEQRVIEFECKSQRDYEMWTQGVARLLHLAAKRSSSWS